MIIYKLTFENGKVYIGLTTKTLESRLAKHLNERRYKTKFKLYKAMNKYKFFSVEIIDTADTYKQLQKLERHYIKYYDSFKIGYNMTLGGEGSYGLVMPQSAKDTLSKVDKSYTQTKEYRDNMSIVTSGKLNGMFDKKHTNSSKLKMAISRGSKSFDMFKAITIGLPKSRNLQVSKGDYIGTFTNKSVVYRKYGIHMSHILLVLKGKLKHIKGYVFEYHK